MTGLEYGLLFLINLVAGTLASVTGAFVNQLLSPFTAQVTAFIAGLINPFLTALNIPGINLGS